MGSQAWPRKQAFLPSNGGGCFAFSHWKLSVSPATNSFQAASTTHLHSLLEKTTFLLGKCLPPTPSQPSAVTQRVVSLSV